MSRLLSVLLFVALSSSSFADPLGCLSSRYLGEIQPGPFRAYVQIGDRAIYGYSQDGPRIGLFDVSDPLNHVELGSIPTDAVASSIYFRNNIICVSYYSGGLKLYSLSQDYEIEYLSAVPLPGYCWSFEVVGDFAYVTDDAKVHTVDISDPFNPTILDTIDTDAPFRLYGMAVGNGAVYIGSDNGVRQILIDDPTSLEQGVVFGPSFQVFSLVSDGNYLFVASRLNGLEISDISDPANVQQVSQVDTLGDCYDVSLHADRVYVSEQTHGFSVIDVSDVAKPEFIGEYYIDGEAFSTTIDSTAQVMYVRLMGESAHTVVDISPAMPRSVLSSIEVINRPWSVTAIGNMIFVAEEAVMRVIDASDPNQMQQISFFLPVGTARDIAQIDEQTVVLVVGGHGLQVVDVADPANTVSKSMLDIPGFAAGVEVRGELAYVAARQGGLALVDLQNQSQPVLLSTLAMGGNALDLVLQEDLCYVAASAGGLAIVDVSDPSMISIVGSESGLYSATSVGVSGSFAIMGTADAGCIVLDVSDPMNPTPIGEIAVLGFVRDVAFYEGTLYLSVENEGLYAYSMADPTNPRLLGHEPIDGLAGEIAFGAGVAYVGVSGEIFALDVSGTCGICPADLNGDGALDFFDVSAFLVSFLDNAPGGDWNDDGAFDFFDVSGFLVDYKAGCP
ncbi:MAG: hypothetical protein KDA29_04320 [Phycisphaerales bacterium]|nr:hypothetical protein [Phycisphaerales bacterium]